MFRSCLLVVVYISVLLYGGVSGESLNHLIRHYETLNYDPEFLMADHRRLTRAIDGPRHLQLHFAAMGRSFKLRLYLGSPSISDDAVVMVDDRPVTHYKSLIYHGFDEDDRSIRVHGDMATGVFNGQIRTAKEIYFIEPSSRYGRSAEGHSVIYRSSDVSVPEGGVCGHDNHAVHELLSKEAMIPQHDRIERRQTPFDASMTRCELKVIVDDRYYNMTTRDLDAGPEVKEGVVISFISSYVNRVKEIYEQTDFSGIPGITFAIHTLIIQTQPQAGFEQDNLGVETYLERHSQANYTEFCLSYRFTARDFSDGVLGLAYIGKTQAGNVGGICERFRNVNGQQKTLNTGIVTIVNYGREVPQLVVQLTLAHEIGHNFGSQHDTAGCGPANGDGNYIMFPHASTGTQPNNDEFSDCSRTMMAAVINAKGGCFTPSNGTICGNGVVEYPEDCDCGRFVNGSRINDDPCCNCDACELHNNSISCHPSQGACCSDDCAFLNSSIVCSAQSECSAESNCTGTSVACPDPVHLDLPCRDDTLYCVNGSCSGSYCLALGLEPCECMAQSERCSVCCMINSTTCVPTSALVSMYSDLLPSDGLRTPPGGVCLDNLGYCDFLGNCRPTASEGALSRLAGALFGDDTINTVIDWVEDMWWAVLLIALGVLLFLFLIVFLVQLALPTPAHVKARKERQKLAKQRHS